MYRSPIIKSENKKSISEHDSGLPNKPDSAKVSTTDLNANTAAIMRQTKIQTSSSELEIQENINHLQEYVKITIPKREGPERNGFAGVFQYESTRIAEINNTLYVETVVPSKPLNQDYGRSLIWIHPAYNQISLKKIVAERMNGENISVPVEKYSFCLENFFLEDKYNHSVTWKILHFYNYNEYPILIRGYFYTDQNGPYNPIT